MTEPIPGRWAPNGYQIKPEEVVRHVEIAREEKERMLRIDRSPVRRFIANIVMGNKRTARHNRAMTDAAAAQRLAEYYRTQHLPELQQMAKNEAEAEGKEINL